MHLNIELYKQELISKESAKAKLAKLLIINVGRVEDLEFLMLQNKQQP
jgi:hypothetical protein